MALEALGVMDHLESLEKTTIGKALRKQQESRSVTECRKLQGRYAELVKRREELKDKLQSQLPVETEDDVVEIVASVWKSRLETRLGSYRLTGVSATRPKDTCLLIRFDTSYRGEFKEAYFLELHVLGAKRMGVRKHTIPAFVPLADIARDYLQSDLNQFLWVLRDYLRAYVIRREELEVAQKLLTDRGYLQGEITSSLAVDVLQFYLQQNTLAVPPLCVMLQFNNLLHLTPAVAIIKAIGDEEELPDKEKWKKILTSGSLSHSLDLLCPEREPLPEVAASDSDKSNRDSD